MLYFCFNIEILKYPLTLQCNNFTFSTSTSINTSSLVYGCDD